MPKINTRDIYALYRGDELLDIGTLPEIGARQNVKPLTIYFYSTASYRKRYKNDDNRLISIKVEI